ncbi:putative non-specific serine/threonine protein kinase [Helianthus anomalus]
MSARFSYSCFSCFHLQALLKFKHGLTNESQRLASWVAENKDCCTWAGIACDNSTGHVHHIHLPRSDGHCDILDYGMTLYLNLSYFNFGGNIPPQLGNLSELHVLSLESFHGPFYETTSMANMKWLSTLGLLHHLDMSGMDLSKAID